MNEISDDKMKLITDVKNSGGLSGDRKAESARAEFDALLAIDLATDLTDSQVSLNKLANKWKAHLA